MNREVLDDPIRIEVGRWAISELATGGTGDKPWYHATEIAGIDEHYDHCKPDCPEKHKNVHLKHHAWVPHSGIQFTCASEADARICIAEFEVDKIKKRYVFEQAQRRVVQARLRAALTLISTFKETVKDVKDFTLPRREGPLTLDQAIHEAVYYDETVEPWTHLSVTSDRRTQLVQYLVSRVEWLMGSKGSGLPVEKLTELVGAELHRRIR